MIIDWVTALPVVVVAAAVVFVPGAAVLALVGMRGLALWGLAPVVGTVTVGLLALAFPFLGVAWSPVTFLVGCAALIAAAAVVGRVLRLRAAPPAPRSGAALPLLITGIAVGAALTFVRLVLYIEHPANISQTNDAIFHLNAIRFILETQSASSLDVSAVIGGNGFYPAGWHGVTSLVVMLTGASIPLAANAVSVVIAALIWPLGIALFTRTATGDDTAAAAAGLLASGMQAFPLLMFQWGVLYPNALSTALIPAALSAVMTIPRWVGGQTGWPAGWRAVVGSVFVVLMCVGAIGFAQPAGLLAFGLLAAVWATFALLRRSRRPGYVLAVAGIWAALAVLWYALSASTSGTHWGPFRGNFAVLTDLVLNSHLRLPSAVLVTILMVMGLVVACRKPHLRWLVVAWLALGALYVGVASIDRVELRDLLLGAWYADPYRIVALVPVIVIPLAAIGFRAAAGWLAARFARRSSLILWLSFGLLALLLVVGIVVRPVQQMPAFVENTFDKESRYVQDETTYLAPSERALMEDLPHYVEEGERILVNPSTGGAFGYMLSGLDVYPRTWAPPSNEAWNVLAQTLRDAATDPAVCAALEEYGNPEYVLDFGPGEVGPGRYVMPGMTGFGGRDGFEFVTGSDAASLWRITACSQ